MSIHVCKCTHNNEGEYHLRYPGMDEYAAQYLADKINEGALSSYEQFQIEKNKAELLQEDIYCLHKCLDDNGIPRKDDFGQEYSMWGRVLLFKEQK